MAIPFFSRLQFQKSESRPGRAILPKAMWPKEWGIIHFKCYPRLPRWKLKPGKHLPGTLSGALLKRQSRRDFARKKISWRQLSDLLYWSAGLQPGPRGTKQFFRRMYASGGGRFPLEVYPLILRGPVPAGLYHYNVAENSLELLWEKDFIPKLGEYLFDPRQWQKASAVIFVTAVFPRNMIKYGERGYRIILKEAGHLGQNIYLVAEASGLKCCAVEGFCDPNVNRLLDIDGVHEAAVYSLVIGR